MATVSQSPATPKSGLYTCLACHVAFPTSESQRSHYRTDWHKYNLKRKIAELQPITAEQFNEKVLASQAKGREDAERIGLVYECPVCRKTYNSENSYENHVNSKRHKEMELLAQAEQDENYNSDDEEHDDGGEKAEAGKHTREKDPVERPHPLLECLFCGRTSDDVESNMQHMRISHGFFLPDPEYLKDTEGLIMYLSNKIYDHICLYCNGRGKQYRSVEAVRAHMTTVGHCKMAYDETENPEDLLRYYDFGDLEGLTNLPETTAAENGEHKELILPTGVRVGHRRFLKYYKQHHITKERNEEEEAVKEETDSKLESIPRRERRARLAITNGLAEQQSKRHEGIKQAAAKQQFQHQFGVKHNISNTLRIRDQVPK